MKQQVISIINEVYHDLEASFAEIDAVMDAEDLTDCVADRMFDTCPEYRDMPYPERRNMVLKICRQYV